jgi:putative ATPase
VAEPVPLHLRNAVTALMKDVGYGQGYQYAHDVEDKVTSMTCLPAGLRERSYFRPTAQGFEQRLRQRMDEIRRIKAKGPEKPTP